MQIKAWSLKEMQKNLASLQFLEGARLQKVVYHPKKILFLEFYKTESLLFALDLRQPHFFYSLIPSTKAPKKNKKDIPISLYLHSHFVGKSLKLIEIASQYGRVLRFHFAEDMYVEFRLYPKDLNVHVKKEAKSIFWQKPRELEEVEDNFEPKEYRSLEKLSRLWWDQFHGSGVASSSEKKDAEKDLQKKIKKLEKQRDSLKEDLQKDRVSDWQLLGEKLISGQEFDLEYFADFLKKLPEEGNVEKAQFCFEKAKRLKDKKQGKEERLKAIDAEIESLHSGGVKAIVASSKSKGDDLQKRTGAKTISKNIANDLRVHIGRSAKENMALLRKAKPWYLWMHLKDLPGNHLFVEKNKNRELNQTELMMAAKELVKFKKEKLSGETYPVQYTEVRFIRPIKGDKLGRVRVQQEQVLLVRSDN